MDAATRIYVIAPKGISDIKPRLVRAVNAARALHHVADEFGFEVASQDDLVRLVAAGTRVEVAGTKAAPAPEPEPQAALPI
jgi:hypothetical protein